MDLFTGVYTRWFGFTGHGRLRPMTSMSYGDFFQTLDTLVLLPFRH